MAAVRKRLSELRPGEVGTVVGYADAPSWLKRRLVEMGLSKGTTVKMVRNAPLKDPIEFEVRGYNVSIQREKAEVVLVEVVGYDSPDSGVGGERGASD
ncbi:FeoA family protein [Infirmifilum sp. NZ]|uniref:FeoA family protein n=1 Tax=Infirmifilum sp. NZ TaxID=2926850 RepID=UPI00279FB102|nr:FeoA family protein [Infirmifilum sp. NZ]UNQ73545.1 ferrous iron transport protein A [Infirmifilum sp. NZ]